ncbi:MAG: aminotransferase class I/II-fold pyridoxal phosphate-dependent enzyme [Bacteroidetes bacterium]|nr:MAG: aminotransferase class I/II-fold pyridoxal phosphate-dependent enzyme [Bacteroidota bacterium]
MKKTSLDLKEKDFLALLEAVGKIITHQYQIIESKKAYHDFPQSEVESWFDEPLPQEPIDNFELLELIEEKVINTATGNLGPHMYAYVMAGGNQISTLAELLATTINQNAAKWHLAPALHEIEKRVVRWSTEMIGYTSGAGGVMVSGGSAANLTGLTVARNVYFEEQGIKAKGLFGQKPFIVYSSDQVHSCVDKSVQLLGIGTDHLRKIETDDNFVIDIQALEQQIQLDINNGQKPFCIIGNAGTVNTGAIDDLEALAGIAQKYDMWFHVDGAYGGLASSLDSIKDKYKGIDKADSIALDFHKWLYQPFEAGCTLVKEWSMLRRTYFKKAEYLDTSLELDDNRLEFNEHSFQLSRNSKAFKVWASIKSYGFSKIQQMIQKDIDLAKYLADQVEEAPDFELKARSDLAIACFRYTGNLQSEQDIDSINKALIPALEKDGRVFITGTKLRDEFVIRACLINHRKTRESTDFLLNTIRDVAKKLEDDL